jgi:uncharacterized 2Fe-2S/4Fe-4S cluster protein (DUF4445 family)
MAHRPHVCITFHPSSRQVYQRPGALLVESLARADLVVKMPCGGGGVCGKCRVRFCIAAPEPTPAERDVFSADELAAGWRLACQSRPIEDAVVDVPSCSLLSEQVHPPSLPQADPRAIDRDDLPVSLPAGQRSLAAAFDIGTTTLGGCLIDLQDGRELAADSVMNPQVRFGDDVISRIAQAVEGRADELQQAVRQGIDGLVERLCSQAGASPADIRSLAFAGNTTMQHILTGLDVSSLAARPFAPASVEAFTATANDLGLAHMPHAAAYVLPVIGGFVGGDALAGLLATQLAVGEAPALLIDVGTNGEVVHFDGEHLWAASAAAGPAFEGARLSCGMRATTGASDHVHFGEPLRLDVIGGGEPRGLCGSAAIDILAGLLDAGAMDRSGRLLMGEALPDELSDDLRGRLTGGELRLAERVVMTQKDIRELQLAVGAIRAAVRIVLAGAGTRPGDLKRVLLAGGFGSCIRPVAARRMGLIPPDTAVTAIGSVGNTALAGARAAAISQSARREAEQLARRCRHVDLASDAAFQSVFAACMIFPEAC